MKTKTPRMPHAPVDQLTKPFAAFLRIEAASGLLLLIATMAALALANSQWADGFLSFWETEIGLRLGAMEYSRSLRHWINDGLMTFFFFVVALELKRGFVLGELQNLRVAALPFAGALGGMIVPAALYLALMTGEPGAHGWGTVMATDTAFVIACLALFGPRVPAGLRLFLLTLAIFDDIGAILVVAIAYGEELDWTALALGAAGLGMVAGSARLGIRSIPVYFILGGIVWLCFDLSGIHATISGVILGLMTPTRVWVSDARLRAMLGRVLSYPPGEHWSGDTTERHALRQAGKAVKESLSPVERLEIMIHPWAAFLIMPVFALANAGVSISADDLAQPVSIAIFAGLAIGKPAGVLAFTAIATGLGLATRDAGMSWTMLAGGACLTGIGFTMSLFIAGLAYEPDLLDAAKVGIFAASIVSAATGLLLLAWITSRNREG
jgi:NhaA family Na+:H+ antiporter